MKLVKMTLIGNWAALNNLGNKWGFADGADMLSELCYIEDDFIGSFVPEPECVEDDFKGYLSQIYILAIWAVGDLDSKQVMAYVDDDGIYWADEDVLKKALCNYCR